MEMLNKKRHVELEKNDTNKSKKDEKGLLIEKRDNKYDLAKKSKNNRKHNFRTNKVNLEKSGSFKNIKTIRATYDKEKFNNSNTNNQIKSNFGKNNENKKAFNNYSQISKEIKKDDKISHNLVSYEIDFVKDLCTFCNLQFKKSKEFQIINNIRDELLIDYKIKDYNEKHFIKCFDCDKFYHIYCLKNLRENKNESSEKKDELRINQPSLLNFFHQEKFYCPLCILKYLFPTYKFNFEEFILGPSYIKTNKDLNNISEKKLFEMEKLNKEFFYNLKNNPMKRIGIFVVDSSRLYVDKHQNSPSKIVDFEYFYSNRMNLNKKNSQENCLQIDFYLKRKFFLKKGIEIGKIGDLTYEFKLINNPIFEYDFSNFKNRNILYFIFEFELRSKDTFIKNYESTILYSKQISFDSNALKNKEIEMLLKNINNSHEDFECSIDTKFEEIINFKCPFSGKLIETPVKSKYCGHVKCFELRNFLTFFYVTHKNKCPICNKFLFIDDLTYGYILKEKIDQKRRNGYSDSKIQELEEKIDLIDFKLIFSNSYNEKKNIEIIIESEGWEDNEVENNYNNNFINNSFQIYNSNFKNDNSLDNYLDEDNNNDTININILDNKNQDLSEQEISPDIQNINSLNEDNFSIVQEQNQPNNLDINFNFSNIKNDRYMKKKKNFGKEILLKNENRYSLRSSVKKESENQIGCYDKNLISKGKKDLSIVLEEQKNDENSLFLFNEMKDYILGNIICYDEIIEQLIDENMFLESTKIINSYYFCFILKLINIFNQNKVALCSNNIEENSFSDIYSFSIKRNERYSSFFKLLYERKSHIEEFTLQEISEYLYTVYILWNDNIYLITELIFGFAYCLFTQYKSNISFEFLIGNITGSFCELSNMDKGFIIELNKLIIKLNKNFHFDNALRLFLRRKSDYQMKNLVIFYGSQLKNYESISIKAEILSELFYPLLKFRSLQILLKENKEYKYDENFNRNLTLTLDAFVFLFFIPFIDCMNFDTIEKKIFFDTYDKKGFLRYILHKKGYSHFFKFRVIPMVNDINYLDSVSKTDFIDEDNLKIIYYFYE